MKIKIIDENIVIFEEHKFRRDKKTGYYLSSKKIDGSRKRLHRYVWEKHHGAIPSGYHVHHVDHNKGNNDISNLELIQGNRHLRHHAKDFNESEDWHEYRQERKKRLDKYRPKAAEWHASEEGHKWHSDHGVKVAKKLKKKIVEKTCEHCNENYKTHSMGHHQRFCSNRCKSAHRRTLKVDLETRICIQCSKEYQVNKYARTTTCGKSCGRKKYWAERRQS